MTWAITHRPCHLGSRKGLVGRPRATKKTLIPRVILNEPWYEPLNLNRHKSSGPQPCCQSGVFDESKTLESPDRQHGNRRARHLCRLPQPVRHQANRGPGYITCRDAGGNHLFMEFGRDDRLIIPQSAGPGQNLHLPPGQHGSSQFERCNRRRGVRHARRQAWVGKVPQGR